ncbi:MAG: ribonuclease PH [Bdellovibrionales bacterium]
MRIDGRKDSQLRDIKITPNVSLYSEGSALIEVGHTKVLCTASIEPGVPKWLQGSGRGWVTAEYGMVPRSTATRMKREKIASGGRTQEISRLIGRSLRSVVDLTRLNENQVTVDCDVIQADGGTRTAAITGGFVALALAFQRLKSMGTLNHLPLIEYVAAVSVGLDDSKTLLDLCYEEDSSARTDMNFVMNSQNNFIEIQGTAEHGSFSETELTSMIVAAKKGCHELFELQAQIIGDFFPLKDR